MIISKICLTGGPCAGKTTALNVIEKELNTLRI
jgi:dephospho-CoA kinase